MKIESRQIVSQADIKKIIQLNESVKGTTDYMKYHMEMAYKHDNTKKGGFTNWKFLGYVILLNMMKRNGQIQVMSSRL